jgi:hypothetical protein
VSELQIAPHTSRVESKQARGKSEDGLLAIALRGCQLEVFAAFLDRRFERPAWRVTLHNLLGLQRHLCCKEILGAMGSCTILDVYPTDFHTRFPKTIPVPRARDDLDGSGTTPLPCPREAGALSGVRHDRVRGCEFLACHARASDGTARARWRWRVQGGITINLADHGAMTAMLMATPGRLAGAVARVAPNNAVAMRKPADPARQQPSGKVCGRLMARAGPAIPLRRAVPRHQARKSPRPSGERQLDEHRDHDPLMPPAIGRIVVRRSHPLTMPALAKHLGAGVRGHRIIASQEHRARRGNMVQQGRDQGASQRPG